MRRAAWITGAAALAILSAAAGLFLTRGQATLTSTVAGPARFGPSDAMFLSQTLSSGSADSEAAGLESSLANLVKAQHTTLLPAGVKLVVDASTYRKGFDAWHGSVAATASDGHAFILALDALSGRWLVIGSVTTR